ncbi:hypothetical protein Q1695_004937 [Nippostrongylus brasiliensis]|nr:hypothetical protein Q1695_004937 [Nippostrongylus brasiliensis]
MRSAESGRFSTILFIIAVTRLLLYLLPIYIVLQNIINCSKNNDKMGSKHRSTAGGKNALRSQSQPVSTQSHSSPSDQPQSTPRSKGGGGVQVFRQLRTAVAARSRSKEATRTKKLPPPPKPQKVKQEFIPYPEVKSPTRSAKKRREEELLQEKKRKIAEGFYQPRSDEDDTLEKVASLKMEQSDVTKRRMKEASKRAVSSRKLNKPFDKEWPKSYTARE